MFNLLRNTYCYLITRIAGWTAMLVVLKHVEMHPNMTLLHCINMFLSTVRTWKVDSTEAAKLNTCSLWNIWIFTTSDKKQFPKLSQIYIFKRNNEIQLNFSTSTLNYLNGKDRHICFKYLMKYGKKQKLC